MLGEIVNRTSVIQAKRLTATTTHRQAEEEALTGTHPDISSIGSVIAAESVIQSRWENVTSEYKTTADEAQEAGKWPSAATIGSMSEINTAAGAKATNYGVDYIYCGTRQSQS